MNTENLDFEDEKANEVFLTLQVIDSGPTTLNITETVTVKINDINESPTMTSFQEYEINGKKYNY